MTKEELIDRLRSEEAWIAGKRTCIDFGESGQIVLDGVAETVTGEDCDSPDTRIRVGWNDWQGIARGEVDPVSAYMTGRLRIEGEMGTAMQLAARLSAHRKS